MLINILNFLHYENYNCTIINKKHLFHAYSLFLLKMLYMKNFI